MLNLSRLAEPEPNNPPANSAARSLSTDHYALPDAVFFWEGLLIIFKQSLPILAYNKPDYQMLNINDYKLLLRDRMLPLAYQVQTFSTVLIEKQVVHTAIFVKPIGKFLAIIYETVQNAWIFCLRIKNGESYLDQIRLTTTPQPSEKIIEILYAKNLSSFILVTNQRILFSKKPGQCQQAELNGFNLAAVSHVFIANVEQKNVLVFLERCETYIKIWASLLSCDETGTLTMSPPLPFSNAINANKPAPIEIAYSTLENKLVVVCNNTLSSCKFEFNLVTFTNSSLVNLRSVTQNFNMDKLISVADTFFAVNGFSRINIYNFNLELCAIYPLDGDTAFYNVNFNTAEQGFEISYCASNNPTYWTTSNSYDNKYTSWFMLRSPFEPLPLPLAADRDPILLNFGVNNNEKKTWFNCIATHNRITIDRTGAPPIIFDMPENIMAVKKCFYSDFVDLQIASIMAVDVVGHLKTWIFRLDGAVDNIDLIKLPLHKKATIKTFELLAYDTYFCYITSEGSLYLHSYTFTDSSTIKPEQIKYSNQLISTDVTYPQESLTSVYPQGFFLLRSNPSQFSIVKIPPTGVMIRSTVCLVETGISKIALDNKGSIVAVIDGQNYLRLYDVRNLKRIIRFDASIQLMMQIKRCYFIHLNYLVLEQHNQLITYIPIMTYLSQSIPLQPHPLTLLNNKPFKAEKLAFSPYWLEHDYFFYTLMITNEGRLISNIVLSLVPNFGTLPILKHGSQLPAPQRAGEGANNFSGSPQLWQLRSLPLSLSSPTKSIAAKPAVTDTPSDKSANSYLPATPEIVWPSGKTFPARHAAITSEAQRLEKAEVFALKIQRIWNSHNGINTNDFISWGENRHGLIDSQQAKNFADIMTEGKLAPTEMNSAGIKKLTDDFYEIKSIHAQMGDLRGVVKFAESVRIDGQEYRLFIFTKTADHKEIKRLVQQRA